jgi:hypothetical protein
MPIRHVGSFSKNARTRVDLGADGARAMMLVYNLPRTDAIYQQFNGIAGAAYFVAGLGMTALRPAMSIWSWCQSVPGSVKLLAPAPHHAPSPPPPTASNALHTAKLSPRHCVLVRSHRPLSRHSRQSPRSAELLRSAARAFGAS